MRAPKLVQLMKENSSVMTEALVNRIRASENCGELLRKVPENEQKQGNEVDSILKRRYVEIGIRRAGQGVPWFQMFWALCIAREYLWQYVEQECLQEDPVEFWGGVILLHALNTFFDRVLYFVFLGYESARADEAAALSFLAGRRSA